MRNASLVDAKAHLSEFVDLAEHKGQRMIICRHGKPAAAIVPVAVATAPASGTRRPRRMTAEEARALLKRLACGGEPSFDAQNDLREGRSRLDRIGG